jgi:hypothetical protein
MSRGSNRGPGDDAQAELLEERERVQLERSQICPGASQSVS